jgi:hypothetical protein
MTQIPPGPNTDSDKGYQPTGSGSENLTPCPFEVPGPDCPSCGSDVTNYVGPSGYPGLQVYQCDDCGTKYQG